MSATLKSLRALSDPTRLRIVALLERDELSVAELQEITRLGQSRISTHLGLLADCALVTARRDGKRTFYKLNSDADGSVRDFIQLAIRGAGEGLLAELLARRCKKVIAVDNSERIVAFGAAKARKNGLKNLEFRLGNLQNPPIEPNSVDLVILSQALHHAEDPVQALRSAHKILRGGGQLLLLDLLKHGFEKAQELYGDRWSGFAESDLQRWLEEAGFKRIEISIVAVEEQPPHFQTLLASGEK
jgi:DNA-binding transcriptional ArsR family regulator